MSEPINHAVCPKCKSRISVLRIGPLPDRIVCDGCGMIFDTIPVEKPVNPMGQHSRTGTVFAYEIEGNGLRRRFEAPTLDGLKSLILTMDGL